MQNPEFQEFLTAIRAGDERAAEELVRRYESAIRRVVHIRIRDRQLRRVFDSMDICQSVLAHFFAGAAANRFELRTPEDLGKLLVTMALNKLRNKARGERRHAGGITEDWEPIAADPTPSQAAAQQDLKEAIRRRLSKEERQLFDLKVQGRSWPEIAAVLGGKPDTLRIRLARVVARIQSELQRTEASHAR